MKTRGKIVIYKAIRRLLLSRGCVMLDAAKNEINRITETICLEAIINAKMRGRTRIHVEDIRRCPTCNRGQELGPLKL